MVRNRSYTVATALALGVVALWACEVNLLKSVKTWDDCQHEPSPPPPSGEQLATTSQGPPPCPWSKPVFIGVALKMVFILVLPPALYVRASLLLANRGRGSQRQHSQPLVGARFFRLSGVLTIFLLGSSIAWVASVPLTDPAINTALYQLYTPLTYLFSIPILREAFSPFKSCGVVLAMVSVLLILLSGSSDGSGSGSHGSSASGNAMLGDALVLSSAALYAMKGVIYKKWFGVEQSASPRPSEDGGLAHTPDPPASPLATPLCDAAVAVGLMGFWSCAFGPLILLFADMAGLESFSWPPLALLGGYGLVALMMATYMCCLYGALANSSPTFVSVVTLLVTPTTLVWDVAAGRNSAVSPPALLGIALLLASLLLVTFADDLDERFCARSRLTIGARCQKLLTRCRVGCLNDCFDSKPLLHEQHSTTSSSTVNVIVEASGSGTPAHADSMADSRC